MKDQNVTRVLLGASSLLSNGAMLGPAGTAMVAALAKAQQIPVIVAAESYKFSEKVQLDSIVYNELGQSSEIAVMGITGASDEHAVGLVPLPQRQPGFRGTAAVLSSAVDSGVGAAVECDPIALPSSWLGNGDVSIAGQQLPFGVVNLRYDLTPIGNISVVATETGLTPPTSIPVLMREMVQSDQLQQTASVSGPARVIAALASPPAPSLSSAAAITPFVV